jgi:hypothetical protein
VRETERNAEKPEKWTWTFRTNATSWNWIYFPLFWTCFCCFFFHSPVLSTLFLFTTLWAESKSTIYIWILTLCRMDKRIYENEILWFFNADINLHTHSLILSLLHFGKTQNLFSGVVFRWFSVSLFDSVRVSVNLFEYL